MWASTSIICKERFDRLKKIHTRTLRVIPLGNKKNCWSVWHFLFSLSYNFLSTWRLENNWKERGWKEFLLTRMLWVCYVFAYLSQYQEKQGCFLVHGDNVLALKFWLKMAKRSRVAPVYCSTSIPDKTRKHVLAYAKRGTQPQFILKLYYPRRLPKGIKRPQQRKSVWGLLLEVKGVGVCGRFEDLRRKNPMFHLPHGNYS